MTEAVVAPAPVQVRCVHRAEVDPLFEAARYTFSVEGPEEGFEIEVRLSPIFVTLLSFRRRAALEALSRGVVDAALAAGLQRAAVIRVTSDGTPETGSLRLDPLLRLR